MISSEKADGPSIQTKKTIPRQVSGKSWPPLVAHVVRRGTAESSRTCRRSRRERRGKRRRRSRRSANNCSESKLQRQSIEAAKISRHTDDPSGGRSAGPRGLVTAPFRRASLRRPRGRSPHPDESCWLNVCFTQLLKSFSPCAEPSIPYPRINPMRGAAFSSAMNCWSQLITPV